MPTKGMEHGIEKKYIGWNVLIEYLKFIQFIKDKFGLN